MQVEHESGKALVYSPEELDALIRVEAERVGADAELDRAELLGQILIRLLKDPSVRCVSFYKHSPMQEQIERVQKQFRLSEEDAADTITLLRRKQVAEIESRAERANRGPDE